MDRAPGDHPADGPRRWEGSISEGPAQFPARALEVPENRVRRAAGLPEVDDQYGTSQRHRCRSALSRGDGYRADEATGPHLRIIRGGGR